MCVVKDGFFTEIRHTKERVGCNVSVCSEGHESVSRRNQFHISRVSLETSRISFRKRDDMAMSVFTFPCHIQITFIRGTRLHCVCVCIPVATKICTPAGIQLRNFCMSAYNGRNAEVIFMKLGIVSFTNLCQHSVILVKISTVKTELLHEHFACLCFCRSVERNKLNTIRVKTCRTDIVERSEGTYAQFSLYIGLCWFSTQHTDGSTLITILCKYFCSLFHCGFSLHFA